MHARDARRLSGSIRPELRPTLLALSMFADGDGIAWPSVAKLAAELGRHPGTIRRNLYALERAGAIERVVDGRGRGRSTVWRIEPLKARVKARAEPLKARAGARLVNSSEFEELEKNEKSARELLDEIEITAPELVPARVAELRSLLST